MWNKAKIHSNLIPFASEAFSENHTFQNSFFLPSYSVPFLNSIPQQMPGFLLKTGNPVVMGLFLSDTKFRDAVGTVFQSPSRKGRSFCPRPWGRFICIPDPLLALRVSTCLPYVTGKGGSEPRLNPRTRVRCRDPSCRPLSLEEFIRRGVQTDMDVANRKAYGGRKPWHHTVRLLYLGELLQMEQD